MWIELDGWKAGLRFSACHIIPDHPVCGRLHGHTYALSVKVEGEREGEFIVDFTKVKQLARELCGRFDHHILMAEEDSRLIFEEREGHLIVEVLESEKIYVFPREDVVMLPLDSVSAESLCMYLANELAKNLHGANIRRIVARVDEGVGQGAGCTLDL